MLTTLTKQSSDILTHFKTCTGQEVIPTRLGTDGDHVLEKVVELEASLPCTTHEQWDALEEELGIGIARKTSLVGIEILYN